MTWCTYYFLFFTFYINSWTRILLNVTVDNKVSVRTIAKTFASGKTEKLVYEKLEGLGLPSGKVAKANWKIHLATNGL